MTKKILSVSSWVVHGVYALLCLAMTVIFMLSEAYYPSNYNLSVNLAKVARIGSAFATFIPFWVLGLGFNTALLLTHITDKKERKASKIVLQSIRTVLCPVLCVVMWLITIYVFIGATGGV